MYKLRVKAPPRECFEVYWIGCEIKSKRKYDWRHITSMVALPFQLPVPVGRVESYGVNWILF